MIINKKILAIIILISIGLIGLTMLFIYNPIMFFGFLGFVGLIGLISWCVIVLVIDDKI
jgi:hypothetical protein